MSKRFTVSLYILFAISVTAIVGGISGFVVLRNQEVRMLNNAVLYQATDSYIANGESSIKMLYRLLCPMGDNSLSCCLTFAGDDEKALLRVPQTCAPNVLQFKLIQRTDLFGTSGTLTLEKPIEANLLLVNAVPSILTLVLVLLVVLLRHSIKKRQQEETLASQIVVSSFFEDRISTMARQVAHDLRSPIGALEILVESLQGAGHQHAEFASSVVRRISVIAESILADSKRVTLSKSEEVDVVTIVKQIVAELQMQFPQVVFEVVSDGECKVSMPVVLVERMLSNLIRNAAEAVEQCLEKRVRILIGSREGTRVVSIFDSGKGIPEEVVSGVGRKMISNKVSGNGLGIFSAYHIMRNWGGRLELQNTRSGSHVRLIF